MKLGQDYIFTGICDSVHRGVAGAGEGGTWSQRGCLVLGGAWSWRVPGPRWGLVPGGACLVRGVPGGDPPGQLLLRALRIVLECILVSIAVAIAIFLRPTETIAIT